MGRDAGWSGGDSCGQRALRQAQTQASPRVVAETSGIRSVCESEGSLNSAITRHAVVLRPATLRTSCVAAASSRRCS